MLCGGSTFGLAACDGAMRFCEESGRGFRTPAGPIPIVVGASIFDLDVGDSHVRPGPAEGYAACAAAASGEPLATGRVGAGCGATVGAGAGNRRDGGLGAASLRAGDLVVSAVAVANAWGDLYDAGTSPRAPVAPPGLPIESTTLAVVVTNARLSKGSSFLVAQSGHAGMARALEPAHSIFDGDAVLAAATGEVDGVFVEHVRVLAARVVEAAIRGAVG
jgi:L-aminopeptidase/D-esterase-like protein